MKYEYQKTSLVKNTAYIINSAHSSLAQKKIQLGSDTYYGKKRDRVGGGVWEQGAEDIT